MKKSVQITINKLCENEYERFLDYMLKENPQKHYKQLRYCQAYVYETPCYFYLISYNTLVAFIDKENTPWRVIDVLRKVYGYTATSAQQIRKFAKDYAERDFQILSWRGLK